MLLVTPLSIWSCTWELETCWNKPISLGKYLFIFINKNSFFFVLFVLVFLFFPRPWQATEWSTSYSSSDNMALMTVYYFWSFKVILLLRLVNWFLCMFDLRVSVFPKWSWLVGQQFGQNGQNWIKSQNHFGDKTVEGTWDKPYFRVVGGGDITPETLGMHHALFPAETVTAGFDVKGNLQHCKGICKNLYSLSSLFSREE